jgi:2-polyprenyl-6-methoxyphenol hydroxylase-like FAD-dependent oxidoreductase
VSGSQSAGGAWCSLAVEESAMTDNTIGDHAVVLGAGMAGLLAARVLADAYNRVTVVERDELRASADPRRGVPQGRHIHGLLGRGQQALDELFGGFTDDLTARGVPTVDPLRGARLYFSGHRLRQATSGMVVLSASRPCLEAHVRARVRSLRAVAFADRRDILGLVSTPDRNRVIGARLIPRADGGTEEIVYADLVVDATGRGSRLPPWLEALGYGRPAEEKVTAGVGYATGMFRLRPSALGHDLAVIAAPTPTHPRGAGLAVIEGQRHIVTLMGMLGDRPPTDLAGFLDFAKSLQITDVHDAIVDAEPLDEIVGFSFPASVRRRYERMQRFPDGLIVMGDGICSLNPIYGQGMSVAAIEALTLREHLKRGRKPRPRNVLRDFAKAVDVPWDMAVGADLAFPGVDGRRTAKTRMANAYIPRLHAAAAQDAALAIGFLRVAGLVERPATLFRPDVVMRVLKHSLRPNQYAAERASSSGSGGTHSTSAGDAG